MNVSDRHNKPPGVSDSLDEQLQDAVANISVQGQTDPPYLGKLGIFMAATQIVFMLCLVALSFTIPHFYEDFTKVVEGLDTHSILIYAHCLVWVLVFVMDHLFALHHRGLKRQGYIRFYRTVQFIQRHPFFVKSFFQSVYLTLTNYFLYCKGTEKAEAVIFTLNPSRCIQILTSVEAAAMLLGLVIYIGRVVLHNRYQGLPDDAEEQMLTSFQAHHIHTTNGVGYRADNYVDDIIENQADKIRSLQQQNAVLSRKLYLLSNQNEPSHS